MNCRSLACLAALAAAGLGAADRTQLIRNNSHREAALKRFKQSQEKETGDGEKK